MLLAIQKLFFNWQVGGDIIENKKTYLFLKSKRISPRRTKEELDHLFSIHPSDNTEEFALVKSILRTGASELRNLQLKESR
jgi:geranylgeranyl diphosphate synthase type II